MELLLLLAAIVLGLLSIWFFVIADDLRNTETRAKTFWRTLAVILLIPAVNLSYNSLMVGIDKGAGDRNINVAQAIEGAPKDAQAAKFDAKEGTVDFYNKYGKEVGQVPKKADYLLGLVKTNYTSPKWEMVMPQDIAAIKGGNGQECELVNVKTDSYRSCIIAGETLTVQL